MVEMKSGYKMTEVGVIPEDWEVKELSSISAIKSGKRLPKGSLVTSSKTPYPYIRVIDMNMGYLNLSNIMYVPENVQPMISKYIISKNDIYISVAGTLGLVGKIPEELDGANLTENANRITEIQCNRDYLMYYMMSPLIQNVIEAERTIGAQPKLALQRIRDFYIVLPGDNREQTAIATALSDVDSLISALTKKIEKKKAIKQGLMQQLLTGKKRLPGFGGVWDVVQLKRIISEFIVPMRDKPTALTGPIPWCRIEDFDGKYLKKSLSNQGVDLNTVSKMNLKIFPVNTLLVSCSANLGRCAIVKQKLVTNQTFIGLVPSDRIDVEFLYYKMSREDKNLNNMATGTTISYLSREQFENYEILIPSSKAEQTAIANILSDCDSEIAALEEKRDKYKEIKQGMMQQLLTGKIRLIK
ncbi:restriction endonuclease subunit S [Segatella copri]|uniref:restriction endonuclease subunit S n=1 Tax=Segatella copri TaxID=165179 RepID=UPI00294B7B73|nr:restriction endonuclease subunit S [Segatella copri]